MSGLQNGKPFFFIQRCGARMVLNAPGSFRKNRIEHRKGFYIGKLFLRQRCDSFRDLRKDAGNFLFFRILQFQLPVVGPH